MSLRRRVWLLGAAAAVVSAAASWVPAYWGDEVATVRAVGLRPAALFAFVTQHTDAVHGLYYFALHFWSGAFGLSEGATRSLSAIGIGVATALTVLIAQRLGRPRLGVLVGVLFALMPRVTEAGAEARSYAWTAALAALLWLLLLIALERGRWWWALLGAAAVLSMTLFVLTGTLAVAQLVFVAVRSRRSLAPLIAAWVSAAAVVSPLLVVAWQERGQVSWLANSGVVNPWSVLAEPWAETSWGFGIAATALLVVGAVRWRAALARTCSEFLLLAGCWVAVPLVLIASSRFVGSALFTPRYLTFATPGYAMLLAAAAVALGSRRRIAIAVVALVAIALPTYLGQRGPFGKNGGSDLRQLAQVVRAHARPGDGIVFESAQSKIMSPRPALWGYPQDFVGLVDVELTTPFPASGSFHDLIAPLSTRKAELTRLSTVWVVTDGLGHCGAVQDIRTLRAAGFAPTAAFPVHRTTVCRFDRQP